MRLVTCFSPAASTQHCLASPAEGRGW